MFTFFFAYFFVCAGKDDYDLAEFAAYDEENVDNAGGAAAANKDKKESEK